jgi:hypothetical protein
MVPEDGSRGRVGSGLSALLSWGRLYPKGTSGDHVDDMVRVDDEWEWGEGADS